MALALLATPVAAVSAPVTPAPTVNLSVASWVKVEPVTTQNMIEQAALVYGVPMSQLMNTLQCESNLNPNAIGDYGHSYGIAQIHLPSHPNITKEQALDPAFAIDWAAKAFSEGKANMWSCYRMLYP